MSPPTDINENAPRAKESGFDDQTEKLSSKYKLCPAVRKRFLSFEILRTFATNRLQHIASIDASARQNGESQSHLARHFRTSSSILARHTGTTRIFFGTLRSPKAATSFFGGANSDMSTQEA
jgi:hypothetical protein